MTQDNQKLLTKIIEPNKKKSENRNNFYLKIFFIIGLSIFSIFLIYKKINIDNQATKPTSSNSDDEAIFESDLLSISDEYKDINESTIHDLNISEIKEKGIRFFYQILVKQQFHIETLSNQIKTLENDFNKFKNQKKFSKFVFDYIELREKLFNGIDCLTEIENYDLLTISDEFIQKKFSIIKTNYKEFSGYKKLSNDFKLVIKKLIINENYSENNASFTEKIRHNLKKLIIVRKISNAPESGLENKIIEIEDALSQKDYNLALTRLLALDEIYFPIIQKYLEELSVATEITNADKEIIKYLKNLTQ